MVVVNSVTTTSISVSWTGAGSTADSYEVTWRSGNNASTSVVIPEATATTYTITGLTSSTNYTITVTAVNEFGSSSSRPLLVSTAAGQLQTDTISILGLAH